MIDGEDFKHWVKGVRRVSGAGGGAGGAWDCGDGDCWVAGCVVKEAKERVLASLYAFGCDVFDKRLVVHLSPPERKKHSPMFDLAMAIGILKAMGKLTAPASSDAAFLGSLSLDGTIQPVDGMLPAIFGFGACHAPIYVEICRNRGS